MFVIFFKCPTWKSITKNYAISWILRCHLVYAEVPMVVILSWRIHINNMCPLQNKCSSFSMQAKIDININNNKPDAVVSAAKTPTERGFQPRQDCSSHSSRD